LFEKVKSNNEQGLFSKKASNQGKQNRSATLPNEFFWPRIYCSINPKCLKNCYYSMVLHVKVRNVMIINETKKQEFKKNLDILCLIAP